MFGQRTWTCGLHTKCDGWGQGSGQGPEFQRDKFVMVIQGFNRMKETPGLSTDFAGVRREIASVSRRQPRRV
jgi:hypothetical protein